MSKVDDTPEEARQPVDTVDLDLGQGETPVSQKRALIVSPDREQRLYLRARLALAHLTLADEADTGARALELVRERQYDLALVDGATRDPDAWALLRSLREGPHPVTSIALAGTLTLAERLRARVAGAQVLEQPATPEQSPEWLSRL